MGAGIYVITNVVTSKCYVGSAVDLDRRKAKHFTMLRSGNHPSKHLQASWTKYGAEAFQFSTLEDVADVSSLLAREQVWMDRLRPAYNKRKVAESNQGLQLSVGHRQAIGAAIKDYRATCSGKAHGWALAEATRQSWKDPEKREARLASIKEAWTPEKRAEASQASKQRTSHILSDGTHFGTKRVWTEEEKLRSGAKLVEAWKERHPVAEADIAELVKVANSAWELKALTGVRGKDRALIHCTTHNHDQWQMIAKLRYHQRGCKLCGYARSSEVQKGRPKTSLKEN